VVHSKHFNDIYGHQAGDSCLQALTRALTWTARRAGDLVARYGGEEFVVLLPNSNVPQCLEVSRRIQQEVWSLKLPHAETSPGIVTFSLGVACLAVSKRLVRDNLVQRADVALYRAKRSGRNCAMLATESETSDEVQGQGYQSRPAPRYRSVRPPQRPSPTLSITSHSIDLPANPNRIVEPDSISPRSMEEMLLWRMPKLLPASRNLH